MDIAGWGSEFFQTLAVDKELFQQKVPVRYISLQVDVVIELKIIFVTLGGCWGRIFLLRLTVYLYWGILVKKAMIMIKSFGDKITEKIFNGERVRHVSPNLEKGAIKKLDMINFVTGLEQLRIPPGNRLEKLSGDLAGFYSIRINDQFRIIFKWINDHAYEVQLIDYH